MAETVGQGLLATHVICCEESFMSFPSGEFGVVYKGHLIKDQGQFVTEMVAIKTLKGKCMV